MKKSAAIIFLSIVFSFVIFFATQLVFGNTHDTGELQVTSQPEAKVYLDDSYIGTTPICRCAGKVGGVLSVKDYTLKIVPMTGDQMPFYEHVNITKGVLSVVDRTFGQPGESSGSTLQLEQLSDPTDSSIVITTFPAGVDILLDDNKVGVSPYLITKPTESDHSLSLQKTGFKTKIIHIRTPKGYKLHVIGYLAVDPTSAQPTSQVPSATSAAELLPMPSLSVAKVTILDTPTGFLRVRAEANVGSNEIGQVQPGDSLFLLDEQTDWYQIKLQNGKIGWISTQYAKKE